MKNAILVLLVALAFLVKPAQAQVTVDWGAQNSNGLGTSDGTPLPVGDLIRIGTFNVTDTFIQQNQSDIALLNSHFIQFGTAAIGDDGVTPNAFPPAYWHSSTSGSTDALQLNGQKIYYWAFNAQSIGAATEQGIFTSSNPSWVFPSNSTIPPNTSTDLEQVGQLGGTIVVGGFGNGTTTVNDIQYPLFNLTPVPEPSAYAAVFGVICLASGVWLRRSNVRSNLAGGTSD